MKRAVFLDKDGTLVVNVPHNMALERIRLARGVPQGLRKLQAAGYDLIVVTNQSGIARGYFDELALGRMERYLREILAHYGIRLAGWFNCPHHPQGTVAAYAVECACRKPRPGLITQAAHRHGIDLTQSWMIGDTLDDVEAGHCAGCRSILVDCGNETEWVATTLRRPEYVAATFQEAADMILACQNLTARLPLPRSDGRHSAGLTGKAS